MAFSLYYWPSPYTTPIMVGFLYCWPSSYTIELLAFSLFHVGLLPIGYTVGFLSILLAFSLYCMLAFSLYCWPSPYTVGLLPILLAFSLYCWPSPYTVGLLPVLLAFSLYCWPSPYTVGLLPILLAFSLYCWKSLQSKMEHAKYKGTVEHLCTCNSCTLYMYNM